MLPVWVIKTIKPREHHGPPHTMIWTPSLPWSLVSLFCLEFLSIQQPSCNLNSTLPLKKQRVILSIAFQVHKEYYLPSVFFFLKLNIPNSSNLSSWDLVLVPQLFLLTSSKPVPVCLDSP